MSAQNYINSVLREEWNDVTRLYTTWDENGLQTSQRPYTAEENATADASAQVALEEDNKSTIETNLEADLAAMQAIIDDTNANINTNPAQRIKSIARAVRRLTKMTLEDYSTAE